MNQKKQNAPLRFVTLSVIRREDVQAGDIIFVKAKRQEVALELACQCVEDMFEKSAGVKIIGVPYEIDIEVKHVRGVGESQTFG